MFGRGRDDDITTISSEHIGYIDSSDVITIGTKRKFGLKNIISYVFVCIVTLALLVATVFSVNVAVNMKIVEGDVLGAEYQIAGFSFVDNDYDPTAYLTVGCTVMYDGNSDSIFTTSSNYSYGVVESFNTSHIVLVSDNILRDTTIRVNQVDYVLAS